MPLRTGMPPNGMVNRQPSVEMGHSWSGQVGPSVMDAHGRRAKTIDEERLEYFGKPRFDMRQGVGDDVDDENRVLPFYYEGKNPHLERIMFAALSEADQIWTKQISPIVKMTNGGNLVDIAQYIFNNHLIDRVPEQGVVRLVTSYKRRWTEALNRYGLGLLMEDGFAMTPMGKMHYHQHLLQIRDALLNALRLMVIDRILAAPRQPTNFYEASHIANPNIMMMQLLEQEADQWAALEKNENGFLKIKQKGKSMLSLNKHAATPDTLILPHGLIDQYRWKHPEEIEYTKAGPSGPGLLSTPGGPIGAQSTEFMVLEFPKCFVGENEPLLDPSSRTRTIGEFFQMSHQFSKDVKDVNFRKELLNIRVHDNDSDQMVELNYLAALKAVGLWDGNGNLAPLGRAFFANCNTVEEWLQANGLLESFNKSCAAKGVNFDALVNDAGEMKRDGSAIPLPPGSQKKQGAALRARVQHGVAPAFTSRVAANISTYEAKFSHLHRLCGDAKYALPPLEDIVYMATLDQTSEGASRVTAGNKFLSALETALVRSKALEAGNELIADAFAKKLNELLRMVMLSANPIALADEWIAEVNSNKSKDANPLSFVPSAESSSQNAAMAAAGAGVKIERLTWPVIEKLHLADVRLPFSLLLFRPHMTYQMGSAVMMKRGVSTMSTLVGNENFMLSRDGSRKMLLGNYTVYAGVAVTGPENIYVMDNVSCHAYLGGGGVTFYDASKTSLAEQYLKSNQRLPADIFVVAIPQGERITSQVLDLTGHFPRNSMAGPMSQKLNPQYSTASLFAKFWGWRNTSPYHLDQQDFFFEQGYNTKMWQATQYMPRLATGSDDLIPNGYVVPGRGHWGPNVYAGVRRDRCSSTQNPIRNARATDMAVEVST